MPLVTCDYALFDRGWQETFDSATPRFSAPPARGHLLNQLPQ